MMEAYICDAIRTPIGRYGGALASVRADDLAAIPIRALMERNPKVDWKAVDDLIYGCANQAGEDNRNVARMAALLAGLPMDVPGTTVNRLCGSAMDAVGLAARSIKSDRAHDRRRRREHDARAVCDGQGGERLQPSSGSLRHHHRVALREPQAGRGVRHAFHAADGG